MTELTELIQTAEMLETYAADCFPANEQGQVHFARAMMESAAPALRAADAEINRLRSALMDTACSVAALKRPCGMDPESAGAIRNGQYMSIALTARDSLTPKEMTPTKKPRRGDAGADIAQEPPSPQRDEPGAYHGGGAAQVEKHCPLRIQRNVRAGCCTWDTFITGFAKAWPKWFRAEPTLDQWKMAERDWRAGNTGWEAAHNAQRRLKELKGSP